MSCYIVHSKYIIYKYTIAKITQCRYTQHDLSFDMLAGAWCSPADHVVFYWLNIPVHSGYDVLMYESMDGWMDDSALFLSSNISICVIICQHQSIYLWIDISG